MNDLQIVAAIRFGWAESLWECTDPEGLRRAVVHLRRAGAPVQSLTHDHDTRVNTITLEDGRTLRASTVAGTLFDLHLESDDIWVDA